MFILTVLFYLTTLCNFIIKFQILYFISKHTTNNFCKRDLVFEDIVKLHKKLSKSQPEDGFRKKAETCSCHDVLIIF
jgi:hypothetical protein